MVNVLTPAYGTALQYGSGIPVEEPLFAASVFTNGYRRQALLLKTIEFLAMGIDEGKSIDGIATHTMRCSKNFIPEERVVEYNQIGVQVALQARANYGRKEGILVLGDMSVMGDCYDPNSLAGSVQEAFDYHMQQAKALVDSGVDVLWAETIGNAIEAQAFAQIAHELQVPLYISVVLQWKNGGSVLNCMPIDEFVSKVDAASPTLPVRYLTNCSWETDVRTMYRQAKDTGVLPRLGGFYNNKSPADHAQKKDLGTITSGYDSVQDYITWIRSMFEEFPHLTTDEQVWVSGCCGFSADDIDQLIKEIK